MIEAIIFDMDGLLIDSEPFWHQAETEVLAKVGLFLTPEMPFQTTGLRVDEMVEYWHKRHPWESPSTSEIAEEINQRVIQLVKEKGKAKPGVDEAVKECEDLNLPIAIASSSSMSLISAVLEKLGIANKIKVINSAYDEDYGKPHPAVYLSTANSLGVHPNHCLAFEDSANGVLSAKSAKMRCIAIPEPEIRDDKRFGIADKVLNSLNEFNAELIKDW